MAKRRIHGKVMKTRLPHLLFTLEQLTILSKALEPFERMILTQKNPLPNSDLALATVTQLQTKIQHMMTPATQGEPMAFDANEPLILQAAVRIFAVSLEARDQSAERDILKQQCQTLGSLLAIPQALT